jgi:hypothetical protein
LKKNNGRDNSGSGNNSGNAKGYSAEWQIDYMKKSILSGSMK